MDQNSIELIDFNSFILALSFEHYFYFSNFNKISIIKLAKQNCQLYIKISVFFSNSLNQTNKFVKYSSISIRSECDTQMGSKIYISFIDTTSKQNILLDVV